MPDYKLLALSKLDLSYRELCKNMRAKQLTEVAKALVGNLDRVASMASFPGRYNALLLPLGQALRSPWMKLYGYDPYPYGIGVAKPLYDDAFWKKRRVALESCKPFTTDQLNTIDSAIGRGQTTLEFGLDTLDEAAWISGDYIGKAVEAMLSSMIVGIWTAFETMAGDLWVATLNAHPHGLDRLVGQEKRIQSMADTKRGGSFSKLRAAKGQEGDKSILIKNIHDITIGTYDLSSKMGDLLSAKVDFTSLWEIRRAYSLAFDEEKVGKAVTAAVDAALADNAIDALAQVRNIIVHKAGVVDVDYEKNRRTLPTMPQVGEGQPIPLDGESVKNLVNPVIACSVKLIASIDDWLDNGLLPPECNAGIGI